MKKEALIVFILFFGMTLISSCSLDVVLINQDPYPAIPNDYVKVVFQVNGVDNTDCQNIVFGLTPSYPFSVVEGDLTAILRSNTYVKDYKTDWMIPYRFFVDKDAVDGENPVEVNYSFGNSNQNVNVVEKFNISIEDSRADFELNVKDYAAKTNELTIEVLNTADVDVVALTLDIPKQENIEVKGTNRIVVGDLDSNEYTTADFEAVPKNGNIEVNVIYTDQIGIRRSLTKTINFDSSYFTARIADKKSSSAGYYVFLIIIVALIFWWIYKRKKKKKERLMRRGMAKL